MKKPLIKLDDFPLLSWHTRPDSRNDARGFTLIELLIVIAIIGVLASIILASVSSARQKSRDARRLTDIKQIQNALELYYDSQVSEYPLASTTCDDTYANGLEELVTGGFIPTVPRDPLPNAGGTLKCYFYTTNDTSPRKAYHLGAMLEDTANPALASDKNCDSTDNDPVCAPDTTFGPAGTPFDGTAAGVYDVTP